MSVDAASNASTTQVREGYRFDETAAARWMSENVAGFHGPLTVEQFKGGQSADQPRLFTTAPVPAIRNVLERAGWSVEDVEFFEVNEKIAVVAMIAAKKPNIPAEKLNMNGGATAPGHPIGASGARIMATLLGALQNCGLQRGVASLCIGGGEAVAVEVIQAGAGPWN